MEKQIVVLGQVSSCTLGGGVGIEMEQGRWSYVNIGPIPA